MNIKFLKKAIPYVMTVIVLITVIMIWKTNPINYCQFDESTITYVRAKVVAVNSESLEPSVDFPGRNVGYQNITVMFVEGEHKGEQITFDNGISLSQNIEVSVGSRVVVKCDCPDDVAPYYTLYQYDRSIGLILAFILFAIMLGVVGKTKGLRAGLALVVTLLIVAGGIIPLIYSGHPPILITLIACLVITAITLVLLNGFSKKTAVAILSTLIGLLISTLFYIIIAKLLYITGYNSDEAEDLIMISRATGLRVREVLFSGIMIASLGAVMDTSMSIVSSLFEIAENNKNKAKINLLKSGMNIGGDMIGTMCQTLVLAFTGSSIATLLAVVSYGTQFDRFISSDYLALEVLQSVTGSFAVIFTVPITSLITSLVCKANIKM